MQSFLRILWWVVRIYLMTVGVIATLLLLAAACLFIVHLLDPEKPARPRLAQVQIKKLCATLELYRLDHGHYPRPSKDSPRSCAPRSASRYRHAIRQADTRGPAT